MHDFPPLIFTFILGVIKTTFSASYRQTTQFSCHDLFTFLNTLFNASLCLPGSEWRYVIISTVCSLPSEQIEEEPDGAFLSKHLGFVGDANQINVAITRAKEGLCIIGESLHFIVIALLTSLSNVPALFTGNQKLLHCNKTWRNLLSHYSAVQALTVAENISVCGAR